MMRKSSVERSSLSGGPLRVKNDSSGNRSSSGTCGNRLSLGRRSIPVSTSRYSAFGVVPPAKKRLSRGSGMGVRGGAVKDPRPLSDKGYQHKCIKTILQFLTERGYPNSITPKILQSPTSKDFLKIFEFIYGHVDEKFRTGKKPEEEIPKLFKQMGYPFMISKTAMFAIGSPHTWPNLLSALCWLSELINHLLMSNEDVDNFVFPANAHDFDSIPENKLIYNYVSETYGVFMQGYDDYTEQDEILSRTLKQKFTGMAGGVDALIEENNRLAQELELLEQDSDKLRSYQQMEEVLISDLNRFEGYLNELDVHKRSSEQHLVEAEEEYTNLASELESLSHKNQQMQAVYDNQEFTPADVERIRLNRKELQRQIEEVEKREASVDQEIWTEEMGLTKDREQIETKCDAYNKLAQNLKLIPITAENAFGIDYELKPNYNSYMNTEYATSIRPALNQLKKSCKDSVCKIETAKIEHLEQLEQAVEYVSDAQTELNLLESKYKRAEEEVECRRQVNVKENEQVHQESEALQQELMQLQKSSQLTVQDADKEIRDCRKWAQLQVLDLKKKEENNVLFLKNIICEFIDHQCAMQTCVHGKLEKSQERLSRLQDQ